MNLKQQNFKKMLLDTSLFRKAYIILITTEMLAFLDIPSLALKSIVLVWGFFVLIHNFFLEKLAFKVRHGYLLWSFLALMVLTSVVHISIWFVPNLVITYFTAVCFFMFYGAYTEKNHEKIEKEMNFILKFFVNFALIFGLGSLASLFFGQNLTVLGYNLGVYKDRLIGVYTNSNILAFSMIEGIVSCDILYNDYMKTKFKNNSIGNWKLILCLFVSFVCLFLSDSNASFVFIVIYATIRVFCNLFFRSGNQNTAQLFKSILLTFCFCILMMSGSFYLRNCCQNFMNTLITDAYKYEDSIAKRSEHEAETQIPEKEEPPAEETKNSTPEPSAAVTEEEIHIGRQNYEVSSGRIALFKQGIIIFKHHPWIGIGRANLNLYAKKYIDGGLRHPDLHNGYLTILVSTGIIGFAIFALFSLVVSLDICKYLFIFVRKNCFGIFCKFFSALVAYCGYCLFEKAILFDMTFMVGFFWLILGYAVSYTQNKKTEKLKGVTNI